MDNAQILAEIKKAGLLTTDGGLLNAEQTKQFIVDTVDSTAFLKQIRVEKDIATSRQLSIMNLEGRLMHKPVEDVEPADDKLRKPTFSNRSLTPVEAMLPVNISLDWFEQNIMKENAKALLQAEISKEAGNELLDLLFNGDTADVSADAPFLNICDGVFKKITADADKIFYDRGVSVDWKGVVFPNLWKLLPDRYKANPSDLVYLTSFDVESEYRSQLADRATALGDAYLTENRRAMYKGSIVEPVPFLPYGKVLLTKKSNLVIGFGREMSIYQQFVPRKRRFEYTLTTKIDYNYVLTPLTVFTV